MIMDLLVAGAVWTFLLDMLLKRNMFIIFDITVRLCFDIFLLLLAGGSNQKEIWRDAAKKAATYFQGI
jgi:hypothetical protein